MPDGALQAVLEAAHAAWPDVQISDERFLEYVQDRLPPGETVEAALAALHTGDLYLACACAQGNDRALRHFEERFIAPIATYLRRVDAVPGVLEEV